MHLIPLKTPNKGLQQEVLPPTLGGLIKASTIIKAPPYKRNTIKTTPPSKVIPHYN